MIKRKQKNKKPRSNSTNKKKPGTEYQEIVSLIMRALDPGAIIEEGIWKEGPDGLREIDISIQGTLDGSKKFILVECKDWQKPVGIEPIDALDSKSKDLNADLVIIVSNSGFTSTAMNKARRLGIKAVSAIKEGDNRIKHKINFELISKEIGGDKYRLILHVHSSSKDIPPPNWQNSDLLFEGKPVLNWISKQSTILAEDNIKKVVASYMFDIPNEFTILNHHIILYGITFEMHCSTRWVSQIVNLDLTLGLVDHLINSAILPPNESLSIGWIDLNNFKPTEYERDDNRGGLVINIDLVKGIKPNKAQETPDLDKIIKSVEISKE